jgi:RNA polymerase sigma-70 factor (ECF subfamily)
MAGSKHHRPLDSKINGSDFNTTRWSLVARVGGTGSNEADDALDHLCAIYWRPVYAEIRRRGMSPDDAQDLTQEFFARLLRHNTFGRAEPGKGRLRSYLLAALDHFIADQKRQNRALKRGGGEVVLSIDADRGELWFMNLAVSAMTPAEAFDHGWAVILMDRALEALRAEYQDSGRGRIFDAAVPFLAAENGGQGYDAACAAADLSPEAFRVAVHRLRKRFRSRVHEQVEATVAEPSDVDAEMKHLFGI